MSDDVGFLSVAELGARYRDGRLTPIAVVEAALARIARTDPKLNAFADPMAEIAYADAKRRTEELASGLDLGSLHGIPFAIKDIIDVAGVPTGFGTRARTPQMPTSDAAVVARLRAAGAVIMGKSNLLEFAYGIAHPSIGQTNNPHDPGRTAGGSSGGSAAAVAAGIVPVAIGTDTGGSIRIPASYCGIVGIKPTYGIVPTHGVFPLSWTLDHAGPIARNIADLATALSCLAAVPVDLTARSLEGLRIGLIRRHFGSHEVTPGVRGALDGALDILRMKGAKLVDVDIPQLSHANHALITIVHPEASVVHEELLKQNPGGYAPLTRQQLEAGASVPAMEYVRAMHLRGVLRAAVEAAFVDVDVLASPSVPFVAPASDPQIEDGDGELLSAGFANVSGHPSLSLNAGVSEGMPVGLQLTGRHGHDSELLTIGAAVEAAFPPTPRPPLD